MIQLPNVPTETDFFAFQGGVDLLTPALRKPPGSVISSSNYEPDALGGYSRRKGYERFDGRPRPSDATYRDIACTLSVAIAPGALVTIGASSGLFVKLVTGGCILTGVTGTIPVSTSMTVAGSPVGATATVVNLATPITPEQEAQHLVDCAAVVRTPIAPPTGSGPVRGVCLYGGSVYCFRDNAGATAGQMFKSTPAGWALVATGEVVAFTNANLSVGEGDTLTQGGNTAIISRLVLETGSLASGVNTGRLVITGRAPGNFAAGAATSTGGGTLTLSGIQSANALPAGGRYEFEIHNFYGQLSAKCMYGANGVGPCFEFNGTALVLLRTGAASDKPSFIRENNGYLYVGLGSSLMNSSVGNPHRWQASEGAAEYATGDTITGIASLPGDALGVLSRNSSKVLYGSSSADWQLKTLREDVGAVPYTVANMSEVYMLDDRGITSVSAVQAFGNFSDATLSRKIQPLIDAMRSKVVASYVSRQKGHYVLLMSDNTTMVMGIDGKRLTGFMPGILDFMPTCVFSGEDESGIERILVGAADGNVYEMDVGSTFDGAEIEAHLRLSYYHSKSPRMRKRYRRLVLEMEVVLYATIGFIADFSYGTPQVREVESQALSLGGTGGAWDSVVWDQFFWDSQSVIQPSLKLEGSGLNMSLYFYSRTVLDFGHTLQGGIIHWSPRRQARGNS